MKARVLGAAAALAAVLLSSADAHAGGFYLTGRGVLAQGRGYALVAGARGPHSLWYNPAGLSWSGQQALFDASLTLLDAEFTRIDGGGNTLTTVEASPPPVPIPTLAYTDDFGLEDWTFGLGVMAPNALLLDWPSKVTVEGMTRPAPQRYSLHNMKGTMLAHLIAGIAWEPIEGLSIGLAPQLIFGSFRAKVTLSACDRALCAQPENPEYDGLSELEMGPALEFSMGAGVTYDAGIVRVGASFMTPYELDGDARIHVRLPEAAVFDGATVDGNRVKMSIDFPWIVRGGVEVRPIDHLRIEAGLVFENWSSQERIRIVPKDVWIRNAHAIGDYQVGPVDIPRKMNNVFSVRAGGSYDGLVDERLALRLGLTYENSAFDDAYLTPLTLDSTKVIASLGASFEVTDDVWIDASYGHLFLVDRKVRNSKVPQPNPIRPPPDEDQDPPEGKVYIGNGDYEMEGNIFGIGVRWKPGGADARAAASGDTEPAGEGPSKSSKQGPQSGEGKPQNDGGEGGGTQPWYEGGGGSSGSQDGSSQDDSSQNGSSQNGSSDQAEPNDRPWYEQGSSE